MVQVLVQDYLVHVPDHRTSSRRHYSIEAETHLGDQFRVGVHGEMEVDGSAPCLVVVIRVIPLFELESRADWDWRLDLSVYRYLRQYQHLRRLVMSEIFVHHMERMQALDLLAGRKMVHGCIRLLKHSQI